jgi:hypothetical protein
LFDFKLSVQRQNIRVIISPRVVESEILKCSVFVKMNHIEIIQIPPQGTNNPRTYKKPIKSCHVTKEEYLYTIYQLKPLLDSCPGAYVRRIRGVHCDIMSPFNQVLGEIIRTLHGTAETHTWIVIFRDLQYPHAIIPA